MVVRESRSEPRHPTLLSLEGDSTIVISRVFRAPPALVFEVWTQPELVSRWWAPKCLGLTVAEITADVRVGGGYRYVLDTPHGPVAFRGEYHEITPSSRLVYTEVFEQQPTAPALVTVTFEEDAGRTRVVSRSVYPSAEVRDAVIQSGMEVGMRECMDQLDDVAAALAGDLATAV